MSDSFSDLCELAREAALLESISSLLNWDERTLMPPEAGEYRADQIAYVAGLLHRKRTDPRIGELLSELGDDADPHSDRGATIARIRRDYEKQTKLPAELVEEISRATVLGQQSWVTARENDDFATFAPKLEHIIDLRRQEAEAIGYEENIYDAPLDEYEPDESTANVSRVLAELRNDLVPLVAAIADSGRQAPIEILQRSYPVDLQEQIGRQAASAIGFDFQRGRLDVTHHPFCSGMGPNDCRITTRYDKYFFSGAFFGTLHESGHGIYDQGLRTEQFGLPPGTYVSLGIHESQSRMWENMVGRSRAFWEYFYPTMQETFPQSVGDVSLDDFFFAINDVRPSLIRVEADEATYNLHIIIRFELEQALLAGDVPIPDLPAAWNEKYREFLGIEPPNDADGVLQDIHWSAGLLGYFPTYSLGNLYAAQLFATADEELGGLDEQFARGEFTPLRSWLNEKVHHPGRCYSAAELAQRITGKPLSHVPLIDYLKAKLSPLYGL